MTAKDAIDAATSASASEWRRLYDTFCMPRGGCRHEPLANEPAGMRWTWCPECLTVFNDYGEAVNRIPEFQ